jgi:molybdenum cofactor guanylyltransferase
MPAPEPKPVAGAVLAGGSSRRLGRDKALLTLDGETLLTRALQVLGQVTGELLVIGPSTRVVPPPTRLVSDARPGCGPLGGIYSALLATAAPHVLVVACDMPFLNADLLSHLLSLREDTDVVLPVVGCLGQQLHAVWSGSCRETIRRHIDCGDLQISHVFDDLRVRRVEEQELQRFDPSLRSFFNVNTARDWVLAQTER